ncbi:hypothetical protein MKW98_009977 [Papaver atlanticum]|uniref:Uncharacterized protein n=1 Tax=Papaver atlanticum TaxID=357466 RepID=A0AAD4XPY1_9MAGN|nr:hypothetical protein MKW98_009977 [Papaver atlanticum]
MAGGATSQLGLWMYDSSVTQQVQIERTPKSIDAGEELIRQKVRVWWPHDKKFYQGTIESYNRKSKNHKPQDGQIEKLELKKEKREAIEEFEPEASKEKREIGIGFLNLATKEKHFNQKG